MRKIALFGEDTGHETFLTALLNRVASDSGVGSRIIPLSSRGGITKVSYEFKKYLEDVSKYVADRPDLIILATDSNCTGFNKRRQQMEEAAASFPELKELVCYAIPDPHIERWMLLDAEAFKRVLGRGCTLPALKCEKGEYKRLLEQEIRDAGARPLIGGFEYAEEIVNEMNLANAEISEPTFGKLMKCLKATFNTWKNEMAMGT